jgi:hypothetical protein
VFNLRLRQAETAFAEGRLNEAARLAEQPEVRDHRDGQILLTKIIDAFVTRGCEHLNAGRLNEAVADCGEARKLAGGQSAVAQLAADIDAANRDAERKALRKQQVAAVAGKEITRGELDLGAKLLARFEAEDSAAGSVAGRINEQIAVSRERVAVATERARREVEAGHARASVAAILELQKLSPSHPDLVSLIDQVTTPVVSQLWFEVEASRLDRVEALIDTVRPLVGFDPELTEVCRAIEVAREVNSLLEAARFDEAYLRMRKLAPLLGNVAWLDSLANKTRAAAELAVELQSSPLSLLNESPREQTKRESYPTDFASSDEKKPADFHGIHPNSLPEQFVLQIDGVGCALLLRQPKVTFGAPTHARICDVALTGFSGSGLLTIERSSGRYQLMAGKASDVAVNERASQEKTLSDGDIVQVGKRCRFRFRCPTAAVPTAVLELSGTRLSRPDIRSVVLFDETLIVGAGPSSHLVTRDLDQPLILFVRDGAFYVRSGLPDRAQRFSTDGAPQGARLLTLDSPVEIGGTRVTIFPASV